MRAPTRRREQQVLKALIQLYIERREPVSSRMLEESQDLGVKSSTIRSVLHELERRGYLTQPHTSAGRVPTDEGYRAYVDSIFPDTEADAADRRAVEQAVREAGEDLEVLLRAMAKVLGTFSRNIAILAGPREKSPLVTGVDLYQRDSSRVLVVVSLEGGAVRTELVQLHRPVQQESLVAAATFLAERLAGRTLDEIHADIDAMLRPSAPEVAVGVAQRARSLFDPAGTLHLTFEGVTEALQQPEFADPQRLKSLLEVMSHAEEFERALEALVAPGDVSLAIGHENALPVLHPFSLLATRFELSNRYGYLAVLGPRRMSYARSLALVRLIMSHLARLTV